MGINVLGLRPCKMPAHPLPVVKLKRTKVYVALYAHLNFRLCIFVKQLTHKSVKVQTSRLIVWLLV
jgi:hypothetical protein